MDIFDKITDKKQADVKVDVFDKISKPVKIKETDNRDWLSELEQLDKQYAIERKKYQIQQYGNIEFAPPPESLEMGELRVKKENIVNELKKLGNTEEDINTALQIRQGIRRPRYGRMIGATAASIGTSLLTGGPDPSDVAVAPTIFNTLYRGAKVYPAMSAVLAAGPGGVAGEMAQTGIEEQRLPSWPEIWGAYKTETKNEIYGQLLSKALYPFKWLFSKKPIDAQTKAVQETMEKQGGTLSAPELGKGRVTESIARSGFETQPMFEQFEKGQAQKAIAAGREIAEKLTPSLTDDVMRKTPTQLGDEFVESVTSGRNLVTGEWKKGRILTEFDNYFNPKWAKVKGDLAGTTVNMRPLKEEIRKVLVLHNQALKQPRVSGQFAKITGKEAVLSKGDELRLSDILKTWKDDMPTNAAIGIHERWNEISRSIGLDATLSEGLHKRLNGMLANTILSPDNVKGATAEQIAALRNLKTEYAIASETMDKVYSEATVKAIDKNRTEIVKKLFTDNNPTKIRMLRENLTKKIGGGVSPEGTLMFEQLRREWLLDVINDSATTDGVIKKGAFAKSLNNMGNEALREIFPEENIRRNIYHLRDVFEKVSQKPPLSSALIVRNLQKVGLARVAAGGGMIIWGSRQQGDFISLEKGGLVAGGLAMIVTPSILARLCTTPNGIKLLKMGFELKSGSAAISPLAIRIVRMVQDIDRQQQNKLRVNKMLEAGRQSQLQQAQKQMAIEMNR